MSDIWTLAFVLECARLECVVGRNLRCSCELDARGLSRELSLLSLGLCFVRLMKHIFPLPSSSLSVCSLRWYHELAFWASCFSSSAALHPSFSLMSFSSAVPHHYTHQHQIRWRKLLDMETRGACDGGWAQSFTFSWR